MDRRIKIKHYIRHGKIISLSPNNKKAQVISLTCSRKRAASACGDKECSKDSRTYSCPALSRGGNVTSHSCSLPALQSTLASPVDEDVLPVGVREVNFPADISHCLPAYDRATGARRDPSEASRRTMVHNPSAAEMMGMRTVRGEEVVAPGRTDDEPGAGQGMVVWAEAPPQPSNARRAMLSFIIRR